MRSKVKVADDKFEYYYGILQIVQLFDDSQAVVTAENGFTCLDREKAHNNFLKPNYFDVRVQCLVE